jgi:hypothetical protein
VFVSLHHHCDHHTFVGRAFLDNQPEVELMDQKEMVLDTLYAARMMFASLAAGIRDDLGIIGGSGFG